MDKDQTHEQADRETLTDKRAWTAPSLEEVDYGRTEGAIGAATDGMYYS